MTQSKARIYLARLMEEFGTDGLLVVRKPYAGAPGAEGADLVPGAALRWPKCECGHSLCPDYEPRPEL
ncbi:hypothetical protein OG949_18325 [Streptomyces scopuliridis]|uniref:hypothetical protein n=1 Tax=Streptomyces scopuliridis TaxID=452529 RepID=UPI002DDA8F07|nr:hypothetical protein [Streptomyces scopuliridis]WSB34628.1 hypothetical protein OG949_18325 [Streptomyces scopuliridis]